MDPGVVEAIEIGAELLPDMVKLVKSLIEAGHSKEEAKEIVRRDIQSRRAQYEQQKAQDDRDLERKHGHDTEPEG